MKTAIRGREKDSQATAENTIQLDFRDMTTQERRLVEDLLTRGCLSGLRTELRHWLKRSALLSGDEGLLASSTSVWLSPTFSLGQAAILEIGIRPYRGRRPLALLKFVRSKRMAHLEPSQAHSVSSASGPDPSPWCRQHSGVSWCHIDGEMAAG